jgi:hypothetical protein
VEENVHQVVGISFKKLCCLLARSIGRSVGRLITHAFDKLSRFVTSAGRRSQAHLDGSALLPLFAQ